MNDEEFIDNVINSQDVLFHYGIRGMRWGKRKRNTPEKLRVGSNVSSQTKKAVQDYNNMNNDEFMRKYQASKKTYAKRVKKYGDPYQNAPLAKVGKKLELKKKKELSEDFQKVNELKRKHPSEMTNAELKLFIERKNLEQQYKSLKSKDVAKGQKAVTDLMVDISKELVKETIKNTARTAINESIQKRK